MGDWPDSGGLDGFTLPNQENIEAAVLDLHLVVHKAFCGQTPSSSMSSPSPCCFLFLLTTYHDHLSSWFSLEHPCLSLGLPARTGLQRDDWAMSPGGRSWGTGELEEEGGKIK